MKRREFLDLSLKMGVGMALGASALNSAFANQKVKRMADSGLDALSSTRVLNNSVRIPVMGFGTSRVKGKEGIAAITEALKFGYKLIDTAQMYDTEKEIAAAISASGVNRKDIFITSKIDNYQGTYNDAMESFHASLENLKTDYLDLYLIHFPEPTDFKDKWLERDLEIWSAMEKLYADKKIRAIGVSNFYEKHLKAFLPKCNVKPAVNQIEIHPFYVEEKLIAMCREHGMIMEAYSPLSRGGEALENPLLKSMAKKYNKSVSQIMIRWSMQMGFIPIPRSMNAGRIRENGSVFDFVISGTDMHEILSLKSIDKKLIPVQK